MTIIRLILGYLAAVLIMVALGVIAQSLFVLSGLKAVGAAIGLMEGVAMIVDDLMGLGPNYAIFIALGFAIALPVAGSISQVRSAAQQAVEKQRMKWFAAASGGLAGVCLLLIAVEFVQRGMA